MGMDSQRFTTSDCSPSRLQDGAGVAKACILISALQDNMIYQENTLLDLLQLLSLLSSDPSIGLRRCSAIQSCCKSHIPVSSTPHPRQTPTTPPPPHQPTHPPPPSSTAPPPTLIHVPPQTPLQQNSSSPQTPPRPHPPSQPQTPPAP